MSEAQQVEWLIKQLLARTERTRSSRWKEIRGRTPPKRNLLDYQKSLKFTEIKTIGTLSLQYELPHLLPHLNAYADSECALDLIQACESMHDARRRDWRNTRRRIDRIHTPAVCTYALAALAKHQHDAGLTQQAQQSQREAIQWLEQSKPHDALGYEDALRTLLQLDAIRREPQTVAKLTAHADTLHEYLAQIVADAYRQRGELNLLRAYMQALPPKLRQDVKPALAVALIEAGQIAAGVRQLRGLTIAPTELLAVVAYSVRALRRAGAETLARAFLQGAREYALSVQDANLRSSLIASLAPAYALNGQIPEATEAAMRLPTVEQQRAVLLAVLGAMAE